MQLSCATKLFSNFVGYFSYISALWGILHKIWILGVWISVDDCSLKILQGSSFRKSQKLRDVIYEGLLKVVGEVHVFRWAKKYILTVTFVKEKWR